LRSQPRVATAAGDCRHVQESSTTDVRVFGCCRARSGGRSHIEPTYQLRLGDLRPG
jgi:hypothetical protein